MTVINARIVERGNGLPIVGDEIYDQGDDVIYRIVEIHGPIHTGSAGAGNYIWASVENTGRSADDLDEEEWDTLTDSSIELPDTEHD